MVAEALEATYPIRLGFHLAASFLCAVSKSFRLLFGFLMSVSWGYAQESGKELLLKGFVVGADTSNTIPLANILKKPSGERFISNRFGAFGIRVNETDTLVFSVIGYQTLVLPVAKYVINKQLDPIRVRLKSATYRLREAEISYPQRRRDSLARLAAIRLKKNPVLNDYQHIDSWIKGSSGSMVTEMFAGSNRKLQEYYKLQRLYELYREQEQVDRRLTDDLIIRSTRMEQNKVQEFRKFCNLPNYFVLNSNDYDLVLAIRACFADFDRKRR